ncbi:MAG TPA: hypothetical protein DEB24_06885 [Coriobacteriia bacterium]|nr:hypothetical protein [Coriobacteriia bacterium]
MSEHLGGVAIESKYTESAGWHSESRTSIFSEWQGVVATRNVFDTDDEKTRAISTGMLAFLFDG